MNEPLVDAAIKSLRLAAQASREYYGEPLLVAYKDGTSSSGGSYVRCPVCGIKTGTSTAGLEGVLPTWNRLMVDGWKDPKEALE